MRTVAQTHCPACGGTSAGVAHRDLVDHAFGAPGRWTMQRCAGCASMWLDPAPAPADLALAYTGYHTHAEITGALGPAQQRLYGAYLARRFGYPARGGALDRLLGWLVACSPKRREIAAATCMYLPHVAGGTALDVGCGRGMQMTRLAGWGWQVVGLEPDAAAAAVARQRGFTVHRGDLSDAPFAAASFDAVYLSHVLEHLPQPAVHLARALLLLKSGGRLALVTPNARALGHRRLGALWRGLEPPRHLQVFSATGLASLLATAGFADVAVRSSARGAEETFANSVAAPGDAHPVRWTHRVFDRIERVGLMFGAQWGEELVATARRPGR